MPHWQMLPIGQMHASFSKLDDRIFQIPIALFLCYADFKKNNRGGMRHAGTHKYLHSQIHLSHHQNPEFSSDTDIQETIDSIICDYLHRCYAVSIEPSQLRRGLMKSNDETCSIRSAFVYPNPSDKEFLHWATLIRIHDTALRRRNWTVRIGLTKQDASSATLYHAVSYSDHQAGSFSVFRPPVLTPPLLPQLLLSHPGLRCQSEHYALSDAP